MDSSEAGRRLDHAVGINPLPKTVEPKPEPPKFPSRALDFRIGQAPKIPTGPVSD